MVYPLGSPYNPPGPGRQAQRPRTAELSRYLTLPPLPQFAAWLILIRVLLVPAKEKVCDLLLPTIPDPPLGPSSVARVVE